MEDFNKLYKLYNKKIYSYLLYLCKDSLVAEELLQETFYLAIKNIEKFRGESMFTFHGLGIKIREIIYMIMILIIN